MTQQSLQASAYQAPQVGVPLDTDEFVTYAHVRYAAGDEPGIIWFDPRDGHEYLSFDTARTIDALDVGERVRVNVRLHAKRDRCGLVDPDQEWIVREEFAEHVVKEIDRCGDTEELNRIRYAESVETYDGVDAARAAAREIDAYAEAEYRNAVAARVDSVEADR